MASTSDQGRLASIASLTRSQALLRQTLTTGNVPIDQEIELRHQLANICLKTAGPLQHVPFIHNAVEHLEVIRRKAPQTSPNYAQYLGLLCQARTSQFFMVDSPDALDMAIEAGRAALASSIATGLEARHHDAALAILGDLSFALSRRHARSTQLSDLDEAITYSRKAYEGSDKGSERRFMSLNNLVSQLRRRIDQAPDERLKEEAETLLDELMTSTTPGTQQHAFAAGQFGIIQAQKFKSSKSMEDFDKAVEHCRTALAALTPHHENRVDVLTVLVNLYSQVRTVRSEASDLGYLVRYSGELLEALPSESNKRQARLYQHAQWVKEYVEASPSPERIGLALKQLNAILNVLSPSSPQIRGCQLIVLDVLGIHYTLTWNIDDFLSLVDFSEVILSLGISNDKVSSVGASSLVPPIDGIWSLKSDLHTVVNEPPSSQMRELAQQELAGVYPSMIEPEKPTIAVLNEVYEAYSVRLHVIAEAVKAGRILSAEEIDLQTAAKDTEPDVAVPKSSAYPLKAHDSEYKAFGQRTLAMDEETGTVILSLNGEWLADALGYDPEDQGPLPREQFIIRESRMEQMAIEKGRLQGKRPNTNLCRMCRDTAKPLKLVSDGHRLSADDTYLPFGNVNQLSCRTHCAICRLVLSAITTRSGDLHPRLEAIDSEIQGTQLFTGVLSTGEEVLNVRYGFRSVGEIRLVTANNYQQAIRQAWEASDKAPLAEAMETPSHPVSSCNGQQVNPALVKSWLDDCSQHHGSTCGSARLWASGDEMAMTFIDVIDACLVRSTSRENYFALSYVWGDVDMCQTNKANYQQRQTPGALASLSFPKTIADAMRLVKALDERFLWIDAICMVQDDTDQMERDIPKMNIVYGQAFATIVALTGDSADAGLPGVTSGTRSPQYVERLDVAKGSPDLDDCVEGEESETLYLTVTPRPLELEFDIAKWNTRGWIFQERLLSRRCLYFSQNAVYFQCAKHTLSECGSNEDYTPLSVGKTAEPPRPKARRAARDNALDELREVGSQQEAEEVFRVYRDLVASYSRREFKYKSDVIKGFAGVFSLLEKHFHGDTFSGLPGAVLAHALLWSPAGRIPRRGMRLPTQEDPSMGKPDMRFPSWSWAGWDGAVDYALFDHTESFPATIATGFQLGGRPISTKGVSLQAESADSSSPSTEEEPSEAQASAASDPAKTPAPAQSPESTENNEKQELRGAVKYQADPTRGTLWTVAPPQPSSIPWDPPISTNILSFTAPAVPVSAFNIAPEKEYLTEAHYTHNRGNQAVRRVYDKQGSHCGLWWEQAGYGYVGLSMDEEAESQIHMLGLSVRRNDKGRRWRGLQRVEGEIPLFDALVFSSTGHDDGVVNILVADGELNDPDAAGYRVTVAVMHVKAWEAARPVKAEVRLT